MKTPIKTILKTIPKPVGYNIKFDWLSLRTRPTSDLARLFKDAGIPVRDVESDEKLDTVQKGYKDGGFKAKLSDPVVDSKGDTRWNGVRDVLIRKEFRQPKYYSESKLEALNLKPEDLERGQVTGDNDFGDSVITDCKAGYYAVDARNFRRSSAYPVSKLREFGLTDIRHHSDFDMNRKNDFEYITSFIRRLEDKDDPYYSAFLSIPGGLTDFVDVEQLSQNFGDDAVATRVDIAYDLTYKNFNQVSKMIKFFEVLGGLEGTKRNPDKNFYVTAGRWNKKSPIKSVTRTTGRDNLGTIGTPETIYFGARSGRFVLRIYNKGAEMMQKYGIAIPPTLRLEIECKQSLARAIYDQMLNSASPAALFRTVVNNFITFDDLTLFEVTKSEFFREVKELDLHLSEHESKVLSTQYYLEKQFSKTVTNMLKGVPHENQILYVLKCLGGLNFVPKKREDYDKVMDKLYNLIQSGDGEEEIEEMNRREREKKRKEREG